MTPMGGLPGEVPKLHVQFGDPAMKDFSLTLEFRQEEWDSLTKLRRNEIKHKLADLWLLMYSVTYESDPPRELLEQVRGWDVGK